MRIEAQRLLNSLSSLGKTVDAVRQNLDDMGFIAMADKLYRANELKPQLFPQFIPRSCNCPVALYLRAAFPTSSKVGVADCSATVVLNGGSISVTPPEPVAQFIREDDKRMWTLGA